MDKPIHALVASRFPLSGRALSSLLALEPERYRVVFRECLSKEPLPRDFRPQVVILNCVDRCVFGIPSSPVLYPFSRLLAVCRSPSIVEQAFWLRIGFHGIIDETRDGFPVLERAIETILAGDVWAGRKVWAEVLKSLHGDLETPAGGLTPRERDLLVMLRLGCSNASMARRLHLSEKTVKWHLTSVYRKLGVKNRYQAALRYQQMQRRAISNLQ